MGYLQTQVILLEGVKINWNYKKIPEISNQAMDYFFLLIVFVMQFSSLEHFCQHF